MRLMVGVGDARRCLRGILLCGVAVIMLSSGSARPSLMALSCTSQCAVRTDAAPDPSRLPSSESRPAHGLLRLRGGGQRKKGHSRGWKGGSSARGGRRRAESDIETESKASSGQPEVQALQQPAPVDLDTPIQWTQSRRTSQSKWSECRIAASSWSVGDRGKLPLPPRAGLLAARKGLTFNEAIEDFDRWLESQKRQTSTDACSPIITAVGAAMCETAPAGESEYASPLMSGECQSTSLYRMLRRALLPEHLVQLLLLRLHASELMWKKDKDEAGKAQWENFASVRNATYKATLLWILTLFFQEVWVNKGAAGGDGMGEHPGERNQQLQPVWGQLFREQELKLMQLESEEEVEQLTESDWQLPVEHGGGRTLVLVVGLGDSGSAEVAVKLADLYWRRLKLRSVVGQVPMNEIDNYNEADLLRSALDMDARRDIEEAPPAIIILDAGAVATGDDADEDAERALAHMVQLACTARPLHTFVVVDGASEVSPTTELRAEQLVSALNLCPPSPDTSPRRASEAEPTPSPNVTVMGERAPGASAYLGSTYNYSIVANVPVGKGAGGVGATAGSGATGCLYSYAALLQCGVSLISTNERETPELEVFSPVKFVLRLLHQPGPSPANSDLSSAVYQALPTHPSAHPAPRRRGILPCGPGREAGVQSGGGIGVGRMAGLQVKGQQGYAGPPGMSAAEIEEGALDQRRAPVDLNDWDGALVQQIASADFTLRDLLHLVELSSMPADGLSLSDSGRDSVPRPAGDRGAGSSVDERRRQHQEGVTGGRTGQRAVAAKKGSCGVLLAGGSRAAGVETRALGAVSGMLGQLRAMLREQSSHLVRQGELRCVRLGSRGWVQV